MLINCCFFNWCTRIVLLYLSIFSNTKIRVMLSALAAASLAVGSKAQGLDRSMLLKFGIGAVTSAALVGWLVYCSDFLMKLSSKYGSVDKEVGIGEAVEKLASSISVKRGYYTTAYEEAPAGYLRVSCGGQDWFVCFIKDEMAGGFVALCGKDLGGLVGSVSKLRLKLVEKHFGNNNNLVTEKEGLSKQIGAFTWHVVNSLIPEADENFKGAFWTGLCPVMLDKVWATFSEGQAYFAADSERAIEIVEASKNNYDNFALSMD